MTWQLRLSAFRLGILVACCAYLHGSGADSKSENAEILVAHGEGYFEASRQSRALVALSAEPALQEASTSQGPQGSTNVTQWRAAAAKSLNIMHGGLVEIDAELKKANYTDAAYLTAKQKYAGSYVSADVESLLQQFTLPGLTARFYTDISPIKMCASMDPSNVSYTTAVFNACFQDGSAALAKTWQWVVVDGPTTEGSSPAATTTIVVYMDSSASLGSPHSSAFLNSMSSNTGSSAGDTSSSVQSIGYKASGSSGSYMQLWQWVFWTCLCCCCIAGVGGTIAHGPWPPWKPSKSKEKKKVAPKQDASKDKDESKDDKDVKDGKNDKDGTASKQEKGKDGKQKGKDGKQKGGETAAPPLPPTSSDLSIDDSATTPFLPSLPTMVPMVSATPLSGGSLNLPPLVGLSTTEIPVIPPRGTTTKLVRYPDTMLYNSVWPLTIAGPGPGGEDITQGAPLPTTSTELPSFASPAPAVMAILPPPTSFPSSSVSSSLSNLGDWPTSALTKPVAAGATELEVAVPPTNSGFQLGRLILVDAGTQEQEVNSITGLNNGITLKYPLSYAHAEGAIVAMPASSQTTFPMVPRMASGVSSDPGLVPLAQLAAAASASIVAPTTTATSIVPSYVAAPMTTATSIGPSYAAAPRVIVGSGSVSVPSGGASPAVPLGAPSVSTSPLVSRTYSRPVQVAPRTLTSPAAPGSLSVPVSLSAPASYAPSLVPRVDELKKKDAPIPRDESR